jgi:hypothetical protein
MMGIAGNSEVASGLNLRDINCPIRLFPVDQKLFRSKWRSEAQEHLRIGMALERKP